MNNFRIIGNNIRWLLKRNNISKIDFCKNLNYSIREVDKLLEGRLAVFTSDIIDIANFFSIDKDELLIYYPSRDLFYSVGDISDKNKEKILDMFDLYINLEEILERR